MLSIRPATVEDVPLLRTLICELADFERLSEFAVLTEEDLVRDGFGVTPRFRAVIAEWDGRVAGYACFFPVYSTFEARAGIFLEDLFVRSRFRGKGIGKALLAHVARLALEERCHGVHWEVLDWNQSAIDFYKSLGAEFRDSWRNVKLSDEALKRLAEKAK
jgi:GNAT superfamily N-acetyltransferase